MGEKERAQSYSYKFLSCRPRKHCVTTRIRMFTASLLYLLSHGVRRHALVSQDTWNDMQRHTWTHSIVFKMTHFSNLDPGPVPNHSLKNAIDEVLCDLTTT